MGMQIGLWNPDLNSFGYASKTGISDHNSSIFNLRNHYTFSVIAVPVYIPQNSVQRFLFSTSLSTFVITCLFYKSHPNRYEVIFHCGFHFHFPKWWVMNTFSCTHWPFVCLLWKNVFSGLPIFGRLFITLLSSCVSCLYILDITRYWINIINIKSSANILSLSVGCLFVLSVVSFAVQKLFKFNLVAFIYFCFCFLCLQREI